MMIVEMVTMVVAATIAVITAAGFSKGAKEMRESAKRTMRTLHEVDNPPPIFSTLVKVVKQLVVSEAAKRAEADGAAFAARQIDRFRGPPGKVMSRLVRLSWLSPTSKRHYLEAIADTQRDHHSAVKTGDSALARSLKRELRWLFVKVSLKLLWETAKTVIAVEKVIRFFIS